MSKIENKDDCRSLDGLYIYKGKNGETKGKYIYDWLFHMISPDGKADDTKYNQDELYYNFQSTFVKSDDWYFNIKGHPLFNFTKTNIEGLVSERDRKEGDVDDKIRFWNISYGLLGKSESYKIVNSICHDVCSKIDEYISDLEKKGELKKCFLIPIYYLLKDVKMSDARQDLISDQSYRLADLIIVMSHMEEAYLQTMGVRTEYLPNIIQFKNYSHNYQNNDGIILDSITGLIF